MDMDGLKPYLVVCRGCLAESGEMKNMYEWGLSEDFHVFADIILQRSDNLSELLCCSCEQMLVTCRDFRRQCQQADEMMRQRLQEMTKSKIEITKLDTTPVHIDQHLTEKDLTIEITTSDMETKIYLPCPYYCGSKFIKKKDLLKHFTKVHGVSITVNLKYNCPFDDCKKKVFAERKFLNQHLNKVHKDRTYPCLKCKSMFAQESDLKRHSLTCEFTYLCGVCNIQYKTNERLLVHLLRKHPELHKEYKNQRKNKSFVTEEDIAKKPKLDPDIWDSPKRTSATQTLEIIRNDVALPSWQTNRAYTTIETQTVCDDLMSLKSQNSEEDSIFCSETVSLSDIQTQTLEFGLSRTESETQTKHDLSIKETQTCVCHYDSPMSFKLFDSVNSSPNNLTSSHTQTNRVNVKTDVLLSFNSAETQTCFDECDL